MDAPTQNHRVVLTGATGQLGRHVLSEISKWPGASLLAFVRASSTLADISANAQVRTVNFLDRASMAQSLEEFQPSAVIHCAATGMLQPRPDWAELIRFNVDLSAQLCELTARVSGCQFVFVSSGLAYRDQGRALREDDPLESQHPYAVTKIAAEALVRAVAVAAGVALTIIRPFSFSGAGDTGSRLFPALLRAAAEHQLLDLSPGDQIRDHCAVTDVAHGIALAVARRSQLPDEPQTFNLGSGSTETLRQLTEGVVAELGLEVKLNFGARPPAACEPKFVVADTAHAQKILGWQPRTNFAYAVWELAQTSFPNLKLKQPKRTL